MHNPVVLTIVVPIYNVEKYLRECLDSFVAQTNKNFKALLIDDGSTDSSGKIAKEYASKYPEMFKYVYQENKGLGGARNTGLSLVDTKYVRFFDSDDFMANRSVEHCLHAIEKKGEDIDIYLFNPTILDMATSSYEIWYDAGFTREMFAKRNVLSVKECPGLLETEANVCRSIWRTDFLKGLNFKFIEHVHWEDVPPHFFLFHHAQKIAFIDHEGLYYYRTNSPGQITSGGGKSRLDMKIIFKEIRPYFESNKWTDQEKAHMLAFLSNYLFWSINVIYDEYLPEFIDICHDFFTVVSPRLYRRFLLHTKVCLRNKLMIWFLISEKHYVDLKDRETIKRRMKTFKRIKRIFKWRS